MTHLVSLFINIIIKYSHQVQPNYIYNIQYRNILSLERVYMQDLDFKGKDVKGYLSNVRLVDPKIIRIEEKRITGTTHINHDSKEYFFHLFHIESTLENQNVVKRIIEKNRQIDEHKFVFKYQYIFEEREKNLSDLCGLEKGNYLIMVWNIHDYTPASSEIVPKKQLRWKVQMMLGIAKGIQYLHDLQFHNLTINMNCIYKDQTHKIVISNIFDYQLQKITTRIMIKEEEKIVFDDNLSIIDQIQLMPQVDHSFQVNPLEKQLENQMVGINLSEFFGQGELCNFKERNNQIVIANQESFSHQKQLKDQIKLIKQQQMDSWQQKSNDSKESSERGSNSMSRLQDKRQEKIEGENKSHNTHHDLQSFSQHQDKDKGSKAGWRYVWCLAFIFAEIDIQEPIQMNKQQRKGHDIQEVRQFVLKKGRYASKKMNESISTLIYHMLKPTELRITLPGIVTKLEKLLSFIRKPYFKHQTPKYGLIPLFNDKKISQLYNPINGSQNQRLIILNSYEIFLFFNPYKHQLILELIHHHFPDPIIINHFFLQDLPENIQLKFKSVHMLFEYLKDRDHSQFKLTSNGFLAFYMDTKF